ncbi:MAG: DUF721 domain-containing protein [Candidatus Bipolaricaulota bacterium]|nr:DUF721 domain-containing protein [Candidatus Bipolaricaulota bacterium]
MIEAPLIEKILRKYGLFEQYREQEPALVWERVVGAKIARLAQPIWVHQGVLFVAVPNHVVQHEFTLMREEFKKKLNSVLGAERVREIRFKVENFPKGRAALSLDQIKLTPDEEREIEPLVSEVSDPALRPTLARLMKTARRLERARQKLGWKPCPRCQMLCEEDFCPVCTQSFATGPTPWPPSLTKGKGELPSHLRGGTGGEVQEEHQ